MKTRTIVLLSLAGVIPIVVGLWLAGFDVNYELGHYVISDNAVVAGDVVQVTAPMAAQVTDLLVDEGQSVVQGQGIATLASGATQSPGRLATRLRAPADGTIVAISVVRGQSVQLGQSVAVLSDLNSLWAVADVDETSFRLIQSGQSAEVYLPSLDQTFPGHVVDVLPFGSGTASASAGAAARPATGTSAAAQVPVRVAFDHGDWPVLPGMSARVKVIVK